MGEFVLYYKQYVFILCVLSRQYQIFLAYYRTIQGQLMNSKHGANCRPNKRTVPRKSRGKTLPCGIIVGLLRICLEPNCYLNYKCPIYKGSHINPPVNICQPAWRLHPGKDNAKKRIPPHGSQGSCPDNLFSLGGDDTSESCRDRYLLWFNPKCMLYTSYNMEDDHHEKQGTRFEQSGDELLR